MNKGFALLAAFLVGAGVAYGGYKIATPCPKINLPDCALVTNAHLQRDGKPLLKIAPSGAENAMQFTIESNIMCPFSAAIYVRRDTTTLPNWPFGNLVEAAYVPTHVVKVQNGMAQITFTPENSPALGLIPSGQYIAEVAYTSAMQNPRHTKFFEETFAMTVGALKHQAPFEFYSTRTNQAAYNDYLTSWLRLVNKAQTEGLRKTNLGLFERELGKATIQKAEKTITHTFSETQHSITTTAEGGFLSAKRYVFEGEAP